MTITRNDLKICKPEQLGSSDDAGGQRTKNYVVSGALNELLPAISDIDHAQSAVDIVKCYPALITNDTALLLDAHVFISQKPSDDLVSMLIAESADLDDEDRMADMVDTLESSVRAGQLIRDGLMGMLAGQDSFPRSYLQSRYEFNQKEYWNPVTLQQGQVVVISVEYAGNEDANWPRFEHYCEIQKTVTGSAAAGNVEFKPPIPFATPDAAVSINGESGCTKLRYVSQNDTIKYHGVAELTAESQLDSNELSVSATQIDLLPKIKSVEISSGNTITPNEGAPSGLIRNEITVGSVKDKTTNLYTVNDLLDDPYFENHGVQNIIVTGKIYYLGALSITGSTVTVVYPSMPYDAADIGIAWYSSQRYAVYNSQSALAGERKITKGSVYATATFTDSNYGTSTLFEADGNLQEANGYVLATINYATGAITKLTDARGDFTLQYDALTEVATAADNSVSFILSQTAPIPESFYITVASADGQTLLSGACDSNGDITGTSVTGTLVGNLVSLNFAINVDLTTLRYDISETVTLSPPPELFGLNPLRIKNGGIVEQFTAWNSITVQHTQVQVVANTIGQSYSVRPNARFVDITDSTGASLWTLNDEHYSLDKETGEVTINSAFAGFTAPFVLTDSIGETALVTNVQEQKLILAAPLSMVYPLGSVVASNQVLGDLQARVGTVRDMSSWNDNWDLDGAPATASMNVVDYPIEVINSEAINEDWVLIFTSATAFRCVGRRIGQVATGDTLNDFAPINPLTQTPYFIIRQAAFGGGWNAGEAVRFETVAASKPIMLLRTVQSGHSQITTDRAVLAFRGNES